MSAIRSKSRISGTSKKIGKWHCNNRLKCAAQLVKLRNSSEEFVLNSCQGQYLLYFVQWRSWPSSPHITSHTLTTCAVWSQPCFTDKFTACLYSGWNQEPTRSYGHSYCIPATIMGNTIQQNHKTVFLLELYCVKYHTKPSWHFSSVEHGAEF